MNRTIIELGDIPDWASEVAHRCWVSPDSPQDTDPVNLVLVEQNSCSPPEFVETLTSLGDQVVGAIPILANQPNIEAIERLLSQRELSINFSSARFRLQHTTEAMSQSAPEYVRRAQRDDSREVQDDLTSADLLILQGHAGPVDAAFGPSLMLCSKQLFDSNDSTTRVFPCFGTDRCFRQPIYNRSPESLDGIVDPATISSSLLVLDGCSTWPLPGSIYLYETSILRSLMHSSVGAAVMTIGVSSTPFSVVIEFLGALSEGLSVGKAVLRANQHRRQLGSPVTVDAPSSVPWIVMGDPTLTTRGIPLAQASARRAVSSQVVDIPGDVDANVGLLMCVDSLHANAPLELRPAEGQWAHGALHPDGRAYFWVGSNKMALSKSSELNLVPSVPGEFERWQSHARTLGATRSWLSNLRDLIQGRGAVTKGISDVLLTYDDLAEAVELVSFAVAPRREWSISPSPQLHLARLTSKSEQADRLAAQAIVTAIPFAGARLHALWSPPWLDHGDLSIDIVCGCGCAITGHVRWHPVLRLSRMELSCPACSLLGDVATIEATDGMATVMPMTLPLPSHRTVRQGKTMTWPVTQKGDHNGFAAAVLFEPFRERSLTTPVSKVPIGVTTELALTIESDWPTGMSWASVVLVERGTISMVSFDVIVESS